MPAAHRLSHPRATRTLLRLALALPVLVLLLASRAPVVSASQQGQPPLSGMLVTLSATGEELEPEAGEGMSGLVIRISLENLTGRSVGGVDVRAPVPAGTVVAETWLGTPGGDPGQVQDGVVAWTAYPLGVGDGLGPFTYRVVPAPGVSGDTIFREASIRPEVTWGVPAPALAESGTLRLNGLWGEGGQRRTLLPTGLTVITRERPETASVAIRVAIRAGSRDEDDSTSGGSHWLEHAHFLGTPSRPTPQQVQAQIDNVGGIQNATTSWESTSYYHVVPAERFSLGVESLADLLLNSTFPREAFDRERRVVFEELKRREDTPSIRATDEFLRQVFQVSPLRRDAGGTIESVQAIPIETILAYRAERYITGNTTVAAVGRLEHDDAVARIATAFALMERGFRAERPAIPEPPQTSPRRLEIGNALTSTSAELRLGWPAPGDDHPDSPAFVIMEDILGTTGRRLAEDVRDGQGLVLGVTPGYFAFSDAGAFGIFATTQPERVPRAVQALLDQIRRLRDGDVTEADVQASIRARVGRRALGDESNLGQTGAATVDVEGVLDSFAEYQARLSAVTAADIQRAALTWLNPGAPTLVVVRS